MEVRVKSWWSYSAVCNKISRLMWTSWFLFRDVYWWSDFVFPVSVFFFYLFFPLVVSSYALLFEVICQSHISDYMLAGILSAPPTLPPFHPQCLFAPNPLYFQSNSAQNKLLLGFAAPLHLPFTFFSSLIHIFLPFHPPVFFHLHTCRLQTFAPFLFSSSSICIHLDVLLIT